MLDELILGRPETGEPNTKSEYLGDLFKNLVGGSKASSIFPVGDDYKSSFFSILVSNRCSFRFYESFPEFKTQTTQVRNRLGLCFDLCVFS